MIGMRIPPGLRAALFLFPLCGAAFAAEAPTNGLKLAGLFQRPEPVFSPFPSCPTPEELRRYCASLPYPPGDPSRRRHGCPTAAQPIPPPCVDTHLN